MVTVNDGAPGARFSWDDEPPSRPAAFPLPPLPRSREPEPGESSPPGVPRARQAPLPQPRHGTRPQRRPRAGGGPAPRAARIVLSARLRWALLATGAAAFALIGGAAPGLLPVAAVVVWLLAGVTTARPGYLLLDAAAVGAVVGGAVLLGGGAAPRSATVSMTLTMVLVGAMVLGHALHRQRSGAFGAVGDTDRADTVLIDLRARARAHGGLPELPHGWRLDADLRPADGDMLGGDVIVVGRRDPDVLDLVLVDVSGKGHIAAGRALLLTGALGALLAELPGGGFLPAANRYVLGHGGDDGFATAVHASVDLTTGVLTVSTAGHPPAAHFRAGSGRWDILDGASGPPLGVVPDACYTPCRRRLAPGDALLLYTDGLVEHRRLDVARGIDRLTGLAEPFLARDHPFPAPHIAAAVRADTGDDRTLLILRRST